MKFPWFRQKATPMSSPALAQLLASVFGGGPSKSGATVSAGTALQVSAVLGCTRVIAEGIAQVPFRVMREQTVGDRTTRLPDRRHPLYDLLHRKPSPWQTSYGMRETMAYHAVLCGNAYAFKNRVGQGGKVVQLIVIPPDRCKVESLSSGDLAYTITGRNKDQRTVSADDIWHLRGPSWDGLLGMDTLQLAREAIGLAMVTEETQATLHAKGVSTSGIYSLDGTLNKDQYATLKEWITKEFAGAARGTPMILDRSAKWTPTSMTGVDAQHLETRVHQVLEICRFMRVMPIMVGQSDKAATYASAEQMFIAHVVHTLMPWYERIEQSADCDLLSDADRANGYYTLLDPSGLLRGALKDTTDYLSRLTERGVMTRNEARAYIDFNPLDGLDDPLTPVNLSTDANAQPAPA